MYKLAFIGGSINSIAGYPHFIASQMDKKFEVIAGAFSTEEKINQQTSTQWKIPNIYNDWKELIKKEKNNLDAIVILAPTPLHNEIIIELLNQSIPIICEKPLVCSKEEIAQIKNIFDEKKSNVTDNMTKLSFKICTDKWPRYGSKIIIKTAK